MRFIQLLMIACALTGTVLTSPAQKDTISTGNTILQSRATAVLGLGKRTDDESDNCADCDPAACVTAAFKAYCASKGCGC
ncbi:uncharacterized protein MELLADRAFT_74800 [Melampsora larici-populina 98AG31]|uniref:Secreted protein n=1 Tax=Melampsora larici-populina (strain 98AG31 / pathotype 3-4-7) TaxID=747676 RepID=F4RL90_MELLP|nr:uncharacterized protein MELLADRAFT_74800 [Melampsora larici-populina 98AG31]EGG06911.1 secreted protein [Melampsora larici-populina 98AG31]